MNNTETIAAKNVESEQIQGQIDWADIKFTLVLGIIMVGVKLLAMYAPVLQVRRVTVDEVASMLIVGYIFFRVKRTPEKLTAWGIAARLTASALLTGAALLVVGAGLLAAGGVMVAGRLSFEPAYLTHMVEYIPAAFPQQFVMCSVGLVALETLRPFRGLWRLPLVVGLVFSLAHFWTAARIPGAIIPLQMILTFPAGFFAAFYFLGSSAESVGKNIMT